MSVIGYNQSEPEAPFTLLERYGDYVNTTQTSYRWQNTNFGFNAGNNNSVYAGTKVQPKALNCLPCIRF